MHPAERTWNEFMDGFMELERLWGKVRKEALALGRIDKLSVPGQKRFGVSTIRSEFKVAIPRLIDTARRNGGLAELLIPEYGESEEDDG